MLRVHIVPPGKPAGLFDQEAERMNSGERFAAMGVADQALDSPTPLRYLRIGLNAVNPTRKGGTDLMTVVSANQSVALCLGGPSD